MIRNERLLMLSPTGDDPDTGVIFDSPAIEGLTCYKIVVGGCWRGEGKLLDRDMDEEQVRRLWAQVEDCKERDSARLVADAASHFPPQPDDEAQDAS